MFEETYGCVPPAFILLSAEPFESSFHFKFDVFGGETARHLQHKFHPSVDIFRLIKMEQRTGEIPKNYANAISWNN